MKRKNFGVRAALTVCLALGLTACGDDLSAGLTVQTYKDLAHPIGQQDGDFSADEDMSAGSPGADSLKENHTEESNPEKGTPGAGTTEQGSFGTGNPAQKEEEPVTITISAAGDVSLGNHQNQDYGYSFRQAYDQAESPAYFLENVYDIFSRDDMTLVNFEGVLTYSEAMREGQTYCIKGDPRYARILTEGSVEAAGMGNNHRLDYGDEGSDDTAAALEAEGIVWAYEENVGIYEMKGIRIGFVSVNEVSQGAVVEKTLQEGFERLKEEGADLILACCHWGVEGEYTPEDYQKALGRKCIDWGADLVIGHHPHVLQGVEEYQGKYIVYSLGNFCFGANRNPSDKDCMIFQQTFTFTDGQKEKEAPARVIPCSVSSVASRNDFKPTPAKGEEARRILDKINQYSKELGTELDEEGFLKKSTYTEGQG